jgi:signal transduction histidine kinase
MTDHPDELARLKAELEHTREQMFQMAKLAETGKLVAVVVHELSQPLLGIKAFAQILKRKYQGDEFIEPKVKMIEQQAVHMEGILDGLRQYSVLERTAQQYVDPLLPIRSAMDIFHERAKKLKVKLTLLTAPPLPTVRSSRGHLQQVLSNLIHNALDELEQVGGGEVTLRLSPGEDRVTLWVTDTGRGVPPEVRPRIFESFFTTKGKDKGTGLGLSICRDILDLYGGSIRLMDPEETEKQFGKGIGSAFEVILKIHAGEARSAG